MNSITIGPLAVPVAFAAAVVFYLVSFLSGRFMLRDDSPKAKIFSELLGSPLLPFLLGWKLSLLATDFTDVVSEPVILLYSAGGILNVLVGLLVGLGWMAYRWHRADTDRRITRALLLSILFGLVAGAGVMGIGSAAGQNSDYSGEAVEFTLAGEGNENWTPGDAAGGPAVLNFWASWCPPCRAEMPMLDRLASDDRYGDVSFYAVNVVSTEKSPDDGREWMAEQGHTIPRLYDVSGEATEFFRISSLPTTVVLDASGRIVEIRSGAVSRDWVAGAIRKARRRGGS